MRKVLLSILVVLVLVIIFSKWWPIYKYPAIAGQVFNETTGKPIENMVVVCNYTKTIGALVDNVTRGLGSEVSVTDKEGKYRFPVRRFWHLIPSWFPLGGAWQYEVAISFAHPLYETKNQLNTQGLSWRENRGKTLYRQTKGKIDLDIKLLSLEEKYVNNVNKLDKKKVAIEFNSLIESKETGFYWLYLKKKGVNFNLEEDYKVWDKIAKNVFIGDKSWLFERYNKTKEKIKKIVKGDDI